jgi:phosphoglycolate phosphatase
MKNIIFDMDGTLINSGTLIANTINHVRENIGLESMEKEIILTHVNEPSINPAMFFYESESFSDEQTKLFEEYYNDNFYIDLELYDGIRELLETLSCEYWLSIATNANDYVANKMISHLGIDHHFSCVVGANNVKNPKPSPDMLLKILSDNSLKVDNTIMIGDSPKDRLAAECAGMESILVNWGFTKHDSEDVLHEVEHILQRLEQIKCKR